jgi:hypothetical protein
MPAKKVSKKKASSSQGIKVQKRKEVGASAKERKDLMQMIEDVISKKSAGFVMVTTMDHAKNKNRSRLVGNQCSNAQILKVACAHTEADPVEAMMAAMQVSDKKKK